jgi:hypothetical protein
MSWLYNHYRQSAFKWWEPCCLKKNDWDPGKALALLAICPIVGVCRSYKEWPPHLLVWPWRSKSSTKTKHVVPELSTSLQSTCDPSIFAPPGNPTCHKIHKTHRLLYTQRRIGSKNYWSLASRRRMMEVCSYVCFAWLAVLIFARL